MNKSRSGILLVNPYIEDFAAYDHFSKPLGLLELASYIREHFEVYFINALSRIHPSNEKVKFNENGTGHFPRIIIKTPSLLKDIPRYFKRYGIAEAAFLEELKNVPFSPKFIFVTSGMTYWYSGVSYTVNLLKDFFPESKIVLGGVYAALLPAHAKRSINTDFVMPYQRLNKVLDILEEITGFKFSREIKAPAYDLMGEYYYAPILTSVGCVFQCTYCADSYLNTFFQYPPEIISKKIIELNRIFGVSNFAFYDDALLVHSEKHVNRILEKIVLENIPVRFYTPNGLHIRFLTEETAVLMKKAGFKDIRLSLESADENFQKRKGNKTSINEFRKALEILYKAGFKQENIKAYTLVNVPGQDSSAIEKTMEMVFQSGALPMMSFYSPIPLTPDFEKAGAITGVDEPLFQNNTVYLYRSGFDIEYLKHLKNLELMYKNKAKKS